MGNLSPIEWEAREEGLYYSGKVPEWAVIPYFCVIHHPYNTNMKVIRGNILNVEEGIIAHQVNCRGIAGANLAS
jgi:hypothetical protein